MSVRSLQFFLPDTVRFSTSITVTSSPAPGFLLFPALALPVGGVFLLEVSLVLAFVRSFVRPQQAVCRAGLRLNGTGNVSPQLSPQFCQ